MSKHLYIILGNGFTIDFLNRNSFDEMDVCNLFRHGPCVPWPADGEPGFLSFKHCPNLWRLGARTDMSVNEAMGLIEDIITCVNVYVLSLSQNPVSNPGDPRPNDIYILAYKELSRYLKHLFIYYNQKINTLSDDCANWSWCRYLNFINSNAAYSKITIVTYNYDIWLERLLIKCGIPFNIGLIGTQDPLNKINIYKPHGSISFAHNTVIDRSAFGTSIKTEILDGDINDFSIRYDNLDDNYLADALIPPAGESGRFNHTWAGKIRTEARRIAESLTANDQVILCGLSYWHVDRAELDELLIRFNPH